MNKMEGLLLNAGLNSENNAFREEKIAKKSPILWTLFLISLISIFYNIVFTIQSKKIKYILSFAETSVIGEINCSYEIKNIAKNTILIGNEFSKKSLFDLYIDGKKVNYAKEYKFTSLGKHKIQIKLYERINMDYMFKNVKDLISVEMNSENNCIINSMISTFENCNKLVDFNISGFNVEQVKSTNKMFYNTSLSTFSPLSFNFKNLEDISYMFAYSYIKNISLNNFNKVINMSNLFRNCNYLKSIDLSKLDTSETEDMSYMFAGLKSIYNLDISEFNSSKVVNMSHMFQECNYLSSLNLKNFDTSLVIDMSYMFSNCQKLTSLDLSNFKTNQVLDMSFMFSDCKNLKYLNIKNFSTENVCNMSSMFSNCYNLVNLDVSNFRTEKVKDMEFMFSNCRKLTTLDVSHFHTNMVEDMKFMFSNCVSLISLDISKFNTYYVEDMQFMFSNCASLTSLDLTRFYTEKVKNMNGMFYYCHKLR